MRFPDRSGEGVPPWRLNNPGGERDRWERLVRRIMDAAAPELARLRARPTVSGQVRAWTRSLPPLAALLIPAFGSLLAWVDTGRTRETSEDALLAHVLMPDPLVAWVEGGADLTLGEG